MKSMPPRTHASDLSDDELILFDSLWACDTPGHMLHRDAYPVYANTPYSHSIPDDQLRARLLALVERKLLFTYKYAGSAARPPRSEDCYALTSAGLQAWEAERCPDWSRFIVDSEYADSLTVAALSEEIGLRFIDVCRQSGLWAIAAAQPVHRVEHDVSLVRWKTFGEVHYFEVPTLPEVSGPKVDWALYRSKRIWWRSTSELWPPGTPAP